MTTKNEKSERFLTGTALDKAIASVGRKAGELDGLIQQAGLGAINQIVQHGNTGPLNRLYNSLGKGTRKAAFSGWTLMYAGVKANKTKETKAEQPFVLDRERFANKEAAANALEAAVADPWYKFAPDPAPDQIPDVLAMIKRVLAKADKAPTIRQEDVGLVAELRDLVKRDDAVTAKDD